MARYKVGTEGAAACAEKQPVIEHHGIEQNVERLKARYHLDPQPVAAAANSENVIMHHRIKPNLERLTELTRAEGKPSLTPATPRIESTTGLYRNKIGWGNYMRETLKKLLDNQSQPVPVAVNAYSTGGFTGEVRRDDLRLNRIRAAV
jgi:hypothetical protein